MKDIIARYRTQDTRTHDACVLRPASCVLPIAFLLLVSCVMFSGCGYTTKSILPKSIKTIYIEPFKNNINFTTGTGRNIYLPLLEIDARNAVIDRFLFDGNLKIAKPEVANLILRGELNNYERSGLRYTDDDDVEEYRVHITFSFEMYNANNDEVSWTEPGFVGEATYFVSGPLATAEESAIDAAIVDLARRIVERTIEDW